MRGWRNFSQTDPVGCNPIPHQERSTHRKGCPTREEKGGAYGAPVNEPDCNFSAGFGNKEIDLGDWRSQPPIALEELFDNPDIRERVGKLISKSVQHDLYGTAR